MSSTGPGATGPPPRRRSPARDRGLFVYRELTIRKIVESLRFTALLTGILILLTPTLAFGQLTAFYDVPSAVQAGITAITTSGRDQLAKTQDRVR